MSTDPEQAPGSSVPEPGTEPPAQGPPVPPAPLPLWPADPTPGYAPKGPVSTTYQAAAPPPPAPPSRGSGPPVPLWPAAATSPPAAPARGSGRVRWVVLAAAALVLLALGGGAAVLFLPRANHSSTAAGPAVAASPPGGATTGPAAASATAATSAPAATGGSAPAGSGAPGTYRQVDDLCAVAKDGALTELYPTRTDVRHDHRTAGPVVSMVCAETLRSGPSSRPLTIQADASTDGSARSRYNALKQMTVARGTAPKDVTNLGSEAHWYEDQDGMHVAAYDGNLVISALWGNRMGPVRTEPDIMFRLIDVCRSTMAVLKA